jgi:hypothetical protein
VPGVKPAVRDDLFVVGAEFPKYGT